MGLDMHLTGETCVSTNPHNPDHIHHEDGYRLKSRLFDLGCWHRHPDLHGFIVETFSDGIDDCKAIHLGTTDIEVIIEAIRTDQLPSSGGFFFGHGTRNETQRTHDVEILSKALLWLRADILHRSIHYHARW